MEGRGVQVQRTVGCHVDDVLALLALHVPQSLFSSAQCGSFLRPFGDPSVNSRFSIKDMDLKVRRSERASTFPRETEMNIGDGHWGPRLTLTRTGLDDPDCSSWAIEQDVMDPPDMKKERGG